MNSKKQAIQLIVLIIGLAISLYLSIERFEPQILACPQVKFFNCAAVLSSQYSTLLGIPLAILGLIWVSFMLFLSTKYKGESQNEIKKVWVILGLLGVAYSLISQHLLGKACEFCLSLDTVILITAIIQFLW